MKKTYGTFKVKKETFIIESCEPHVAIALKRIFPKIPTYATAPFEMPATKENAADLEWFFHRYPLKMDSSSKKHLLAKKGEFLEHQAEIERILSPKYKAKNFKFLRDGQKVRNYQAQAVNVLWKNGYLLLGDDLGLGKTYSSIAAAMKKEALPAIMVVQTHLPKQWEEKTKEFSNFKTHFIHQRKPYSLPEADIYIIKYSTLQGWVDIFREGFFKLVVFDEVQELRRGTESAKGMAAKVLCENATYSMGVSATPIYNYADELYNIYDILKGHRPHPLGSRVDFNREWGYNQFQLNPDEVGHSNQNKIKYL